MQLSDELRARMALSANSFKFQKTLGQNFLLDDSVIDSILDAAQLSPADDVLEIGPGAGVMTVKIARRAKSVTAIEIDRALEPVLREMLAGITNARVIFADALKADISQIMPAKFRVIANIPYYITADMVLALLKFAPESIVIMVQAEAAKRMSAKVGDKNYCLLAATIAYYAQTEELFTLPPSAFTPPPHVDSTLFKITPYIDKPVKPTDEAAFLKLLSAAFAMRRKTLANNLTSAFNINRQQAVSWLQKAGINEMARGEALELSDLARLSDIISTGR